MALSPEFAIDLKTRIKAIVASEYEKLSQNLWWNKVAKVTESQSAKERLVWLLDTARITREDPGSILFEEPVIQTVEFENEYARAGFEIERAKLEDLFNGTPGGEGLALAAQWARQVAQYAAYWPQECVADAILANPATYDGLAFFSKVHPLNPYKPVLGTYANLIDSTVLGGAAPAIDSSVALDVATANVQRVMAYAAGIKMPNGKTPRGLRPVGLMVPPALAARAQQITNAKFIGSASGGSDDRESVVRNWGFGEPVQADELGASMGGSDTSWYMIMAGLDRAELGAFQYVNREPFTIRALTGDTDAELNRATKMEWSLTGRNTVGAGHPYFLLRIDAA